jgi:paraquat-inducible protein B
MATTAALQSLQDTQKALADIRQHLQPLLRTLCAENNNGTAEDQAIARAGVALTLGTLRFMAQRLKGKNPANSSPSNRALRQELQRLRQLLTSVQAKALAQSTSPTPQKRSSTARESEVDNNKGNKKLPPTHEDKNGSIQSEMSQTETGDNTDSGPTSPSTLTPAAKRRRLE